MHKTFNFSFYILLTGIALLFPLSYSLIEFKVIFVLLLLTFTCFFLFIKDLKQTITNSNVRIFYNIFSVILFLFLFNICEKVNVIQQLSLSIELNRRIPLSTGLLVFAMIIYMVRLWRNDQVKIITPKLFKVFIMVNIVTILLMFILWFVVKQYYNIQIDSIINILNSSIKYVFIIFLLSNEPPRYREVKIISISILICLCLTLLLKVFIAK